MMRLADMQCYVLQMQREQAIVAQWMRRQMEQTGLTADAWAKRAGLSSSTVSRALQETYASVTSLPTLDKLAKAIDVPSVLDFLGDDGTSAAKVVALPNADVLTEILLAVAPSGLAGRQTASSLRVLAEGVAHALQLIEGNPATLANADSVRVAARSAAVRSRENKPQA